MTKKRTSPVPTSEGKPDGFRRIKGVSKANAERLHTRKIDTYAQLAALSPACVGELVGNSSAEYIAQQWIESARNLASDLPLEEFRYPAKFSIELTLDVANEVKNTHIVHLQDKLEGKWPEWDAAQLIDFIVRHTALRSKTAEPSLLREIQAELPYQPVQAASSPETGIDLITDTDKREVQHGDTPVEDPQAQLRLDVDVMSLEDAGFGQQDGEEVPRKHMRVLFDFHLSGQLAQQLAGTGLPYFVQLMAWDLASGQATVLATDQSRLTSGLVTYQAALQFPLPELGRYQLVGLVLLPDKDKVGVTLGDVLNVVP